LILAGFVSISQESGEQRLDLAKLGAQLQNIVDNWVQKTDRKDNGENRAGRYTVAECGVLLARFTL